MPTQINKAVTAEMAKQVHAGFMAGIDAAMPAAALVGHIPTNSKPTAILALGKAAGPMAVACRDAGLDAKGVIITHDPTTAVEGFDVIVGGHPVPDQGSINAARAAMDLCAGLTEKDHLLVLVSGGGSALMTMPNAGLTLDDKMAINQALLKSGLDIHQVNAVRRLISRVKGGRLAQLAVPATVTQLVMSDVPATGDAVRDLAAIASGPFAPDPVDVDDARALIKRAGLDNHPPLSAFLETRAQTHGPVRPDDDVFGHVTTTIIASNEMARSAAVSAMGGVNITLPDLAGEAADMGAQLAEIVMDAPDPITGVSGGETVVRFDENTLSSPTDNPPLGGRSQELALAFLTAMSGYAARGHNVPRFALLAGGTDGRDGSTDAAGALVSDELIAGGAALDGLRLALMQHESYHALNRLKALIKMPPTGTNLGDLVILKTAL